jgi:hypothetical protein
MIMDFLFNFAAAANDKCFHTFFGLIPWYQYLKDKISPYPGCNIKNFNVLPSGDNKATDIPLILAAVVDDLLRIAGIVALAFVLVGAIRYIYSQGDPEGTAQAQSTLVNALIGLAVALIGVAFISFIGTQIGT